MKVESPCYELTRVPVEVTNPFSEGGDFNITLSENGDLANSGGSQHSLLGPKKKKTKEIHSKINTGINQSEPEERVTETLTNIMESVTTKVQGK